MIYGVPILFRTRQVSNQSSCCSWEVLDGVGFLLVYEENKKPAPDEMRGLRNLVSGEQCLIEANSPQEAIDKFFNEWEGASIGEKRKARWINEELPILELPPCCQLRKDTEGKFICGDEEREAGQGLCILEDNCLDDSPDDCPLSSFYDAFRTANKVDFEKLMHDGKVYPFFRA
jgi:hypothetical protein